VVGLEQAWHLKRGHLVGPGQRGEAAVRVGGVRCRDRAQGRLGTGSRAPRALTRFPVSIPIPLVGTHGVGEGERLARAIGIPVRKRAIVGASTLHVGECSREAGGGEGTLFPQSRVWPGKCRSSPSGVAAWLPPLARNTSFNCACEGSPSTRNWDLCWRGTCGRCLTGAVEGTKSAVRLRGASPQPISQAPNRESSEFVL
jgi:hypothetical protein